MVHVSSLSEAFSYAVQNLTSLLRPAGTLEYCETEMFHAECGENEVVVMRNANYGRMRFGRCVERDYGT